MGKARPHRVWLVRIGSHDDSRVEFDARDGRTHRTPIYKLPERCSYLIEAKGQGAVAERKALKLAREDGIPNAIVMSVESVGPPAYSDKRDWY